MARFFLRGPGPRPAYYKIAEHLWGVGCDFDSDGNSSHPDATDWTELTVSLRPTEQDSRDSEQRLDIDPADDPHRLVLEITSDSDDLARRAAEFLRDTAGGDLSG